MYAFGFELFSTLKAGLLQPHIITPNILDSIEI